MIDCSDFGDKDDFLCSLLTAKSQPQNHKKMKKVKKSSLENDKTRQKTQHSRWADGEVLLCRCEKRFRRSFGKSPAVSGNGF